MYYHNAYFFYGAIGILCSIQGKIVCILDTESSNYPTEYSEVIQNSLELQLQLQSFAIHFDYFHECAILCVCAYDVCVCVCFEFVLLDQLATFFICTSSSEMRNYNHAQSASAQPCPVAIRLHSFVSCHYGCKFVLHTLQLILALSLPHFNFLVFYFLLLYIFFIK